MINHRLSYHARNNPNKTNQLMFYRFLTFTPSKNKNFSSIRKKNCKNFQTIPLYSNGRGGYSFQRLLLQSFVLISVSSLSLCNGGSLFRIFTHSSIWHHTVPLNVPKNQNLNHKQSPEVSQKPTVQYYCNVDKPKGWDLPQGLTSEFS